MTTTAEKVELLTFRIARGFGYVDYTITFDVKRSETFASIRTRLAACVGVDASTVQMLYGMVLLEDDDTYAKIAPANCVLARIVFGADDAASVLEPVQVASKGCDDTVQIRIIDTGRSFVVDAAKKDTFSTLKKRVAAAENVDESAVTLSFGGSILKDNACYMEIAPARIIYAAITRTTAPPPPPVAPAPTGSSHHVPANVLAATEYWELLSVRIGITGSRSIQIEVKRSDTVAQLRAKVAAHEKVDVTTVRLFHAACLMKDDVVYETIRPANHIAAMIHTPPPPQPPVVPVPNPGLLGLGKGRDSLDPQTSSTKNAAESGRRVPRDTDPGQQAHVDEFCWTRTRN